MNTYKSPIKHTDNRTYYFYNNVEGSFQVYIANKKEDEKDNKAILVDEHGHTIAEATLRDLRRLMG